MRTVTEAIYKTKYEAYDGTRFDNESDCIEYERDIKAILKAWDEIPKLVYSNESLPLNSGASDANFILWCRNKNDIDAANAYIKECNGTDRNSFLTDTDIHRRVIISVWNYYDSIDGFGEGITHCGYPEDILESYKGMLFAAIPEEKEWRGELRKMCELSEDCGRTWTVRKLLNKGEMDDYREIGWHVREAEVNE